MDVGPLATHALGASSPGARDEETCPDIHSVKNACKQDKIIQIYKNKIKNYDIQGLHY
jgi:hypothetical protein